MAAKGGRGLICRLLNSHKWVRMQTAKEEAYRCRRCGERHYGRRPKRRLEAFADGGGMGGGDGGGV